jgi:hypothetical protein
LQGPPRHGPRLAFGRDATHGLAQAVARQLPGMDEQMECVPFDWRQARVREEDGSWKLTVGHCVLADLGPQQDDARLALAALRHYRFTEQYRLGGPSPIFTFFLVNGQPPLGMMFGLGGQAFQPQHLKAEAVGDRWALCEGDRVLALFGDKPDEARQLLEIIQRYQFDHLCHVGAPGGAGMTFLVRDR